MDEQFENDKRSIVQCLFYNVCMIMRYYNNLLLYKTFIFNLNPTQNDIQQIIDYSECSIQPFVYGQNRLTKPVIVKQIIEELKNNKDNLINAFISQSSYKRLGAVGTESYLDDSFINMIATMSLSSKEKKHIASIQPCLLMHVIFDTYDIIAKFYSDEQGTINLFKQKNGGDLEMLNHDMENYCLEQLGININNFEKTISMVLKKFKMSKYIKGGFMQAIANKKIEITRFIDGLYNSGSSFGLKNEKDLNNIFWSSSDYIWKLHNCETVSANLTHCNNKVGEFIKYITSDKNKINSFLVKSGEKAPPGVICKRLKELMKEIEKDMEDFNEQYGVEDKDFRLFQIARAKLIGDAKELYTGEGALISKYCMDPYY